MSGFSTCDNKGFHINFPNGLTLSTQFGGGNYCSNRDRKIGDRSDHRAETVEIAVFGTNDTRSGSSHWLTQEIARAAGIEDPQDSVMGYVPFDDWLKIFDATRAYVAPKPPLEVTEEHREQGATDMERAYPRRQL